MFNVKFISTYSIYGSNGYNIYRNRKLIKNLKIENEKEIMDIQEAYKPYFESTNIDKATDPNVVNDLLSLDYYKLQKLRKDDKKHSI